MAKNIKLEDTRNIIINLDRDPERLEQSKKVLDNLQIPFERFSAIEHEEGIVGCGLSHKKLLSEIKPNTLILEDDIERTRAATNFVFNIPEEADAIYLGISNHGYINKPMGVAGTVLAAQYDENYKRVFNMCSGHAILYLSQKYIDAAHDVTAKCLEQGAPFDLGLAALHRYFTILTPNDPYFYQTPQEEFTNFSLQA
tara:strand:- start:5579 stop:6172 length:594 start_codon:yes stop_codon:yes gene_type:complete